MEYWVEKADDVLILTSDERHLYKNRPHSAKRGFSVSVLGMFAGISFSIL